MNCEVVYCIYNKNSKCLLSGTSINALGMCEECIIISLDSDFIEAEKERQLANMESRWDENTKYTDMQTDIPAHSP